MKMNQNNKSMMWCMMSMCMCMYMCDVMMSFQRDLPESVQMKL